MVSNGIIFLTLGISNGFQWYHYRPRYATYRGGTVLNNLAICGREDLRFSTDAQRVFCCTYPTVGVYQFGEMPLGCVYSIQRGPQPPSISRGD